MWEKIQLEAMLENNMRVVEIPLVGGGAKMLQSQTGTAKQCGLQ